MAHGILGKVNKWIENWFSCRLQRIVLSCVTSFFVDVLSGVHQGSVRGPMLFIIYINDIDEGLTNRILKLADDTKMFDAVTNGDDVEKI